MIRLGRAARLWNGPSLRGHKWRNGARFQNKYKMACKQTHNKLADGVFNRFNICEMRLLEYKLTLIDKGFNYFISFKLLILETIVSQHPCLNTEIWLSEPSVIKDKRILILILILKEHLKKNAIFVHETPCFLHEPPFKIIRFNRCRATL